MYQTPPGYRRGDKPNKRDSVSSSSFDLIASWCGIIGLPLGIAGTSLGWIAMRGVAPSIVIQTVEDMEERDSDLRVQIWSGPSRYWLFKPVTGTVKISAVVDILTENGKRLITNHPLSFKGGDRSVALDPGDRISVRVADRHLYCDNSIPGDRRDCGIDTPELSPGTYIASVIVSYSHHTIRFSKRFTTTANPHHVYWEPS
jgi:hypothetical protein